MQQVTVFIFTTRRLNEMNINSNTTLKTIKDMMFEDFGIELTTPQAKEIRQSCQMGLAVWTDEHYVSTCERDDIRMISVDGDVAFSAYRTCYNADEWNKAVKSGQFSK